MLTTYWTRPAPIIRSVITLTGISLIMVAYCSWSYVTSPFPRKSVHQENPRSQNLLGTTKSDIKVRKLSLDHFGVLASKNATGWFSRVCDPTRKLRQVRFSTAVGHLRFYVYNSADDDDTFTRQALNGWYYERAEMARFVNLSRDLPLIDIGGNLGLVTLQAALQGRRVVAIEPVPENALRLCRAVTDFGHSSLVHVIQNAASSLEGSVRMAMDRPKGRARYGVVVQSQNFRYGATEAYAIQLDSVLDVLPFRRAALKVDVESHEGHVLAGASRFFRKMDIPIIWMEWEGVKSRPDYGANYIVDFMHRHKMEPFDLMTGNPLPTDDFLKWPRTVLWRKVN